MTTISEMVTEIRDALNEPSSTPSLFYSDSEIRKYIQRSINELCIETDINYRIYNYVVPSSLIGTITTATAGATTQLTLDITHTYAANDWVYITGADNTMGDYLNNNLWQISSVGATTITIKAVTTGLVVSTTGSVGPASFTFAKLTSSIEDKLFDLRFLEYHSVDWADNAYLPLYRVVPRDNLNYVTSSDRNTTCVIFDDAIQLNKGLALNDRIVVCARWKKTDIVDNNSTYSLDTTAEDASIKYAIAMGFYKKQKIDVGDKWYAQYLSRKQLIYDNKAKLTKAHSPMAMALIKTSSIMNFAYPNVITIP